FQGRADQIYLLPRGGGAPVAVGHAVEDKLALYPVITSATYLPNDQQARFTCNDSEGSDGIVLIYDVTWREWFTEGPFGALIAAATKYQDRMVMLLGNVVYQQRTAHPPAAFIQSAWRSSVVHPFGLGNLGRDYGV